MDAAFQFYLAGRLGIKALDEADLLAFTNPIKDGKLVPVEATLNARREAMMVAHAMEYGEVAVIVCGGGHELAAAIREMEGGKCEYVRVAGQAYLKAMTDI
jgi:hypothetical protein